MPKMSMKIQPMVGGGGSVLRATKAFVFLCSRKLSFFMLTVEKRRYWLVLQYKEETKVWSFEPLVVV